MPANFIPPIDLGQFTPSAAAISSWLYQLWKYLQENPIPTVSDVETTAQNYVATNVPPMVGELIAVIGYSTLVEGQTVPIYRASSDEISQQDLLEAWNDGCRFVTVDDSLAYAMLKNGSTISLLALNPVRSVNGETGEVSLFIPTKTSQLENDAQFVTAAQAGGVTTVNGQTGVVILTSDDIANDSTLPAETITEALEVLNDNLVKISIESFSGTQTRIPATGTNPAITSSHILMAVEYNDPANQSGNLTVTTENGYLTVSGGVFSATGITLVLGKPGTSI